MAYEDGPEIAAPTGPIDGDEMPETDKIVLDLNDPKIAKAFENCEPGETLTLESKDDGEVILSKDYDEDEEGSDAADESDEADMAEPKSAVDRLMAQKMKG